MKKRKVFVDMDDTAVDYSGQLRVYQTMYPEYQYPQSIIGFFSTMKPMPGFMEAWEKLSEFYDMRFCTRASPYNLGSFTEKAVWVRDNMGGIDAIDKLNLNPDKSVIGEEDDYLIDDWDIHGQDEFRGEHIHFTKDEKFMDWNMVTEYLMRKMVREDKYGNRMKSLEEFKSWIKEDCVFDSNGYWKNNLGNPEYFNTIEEAYNMYLQEGEA
ncbi:MAG: 5' nucleotidase, NT5C type [Candidatus Heimdallarchaeaceae archaeon]